MHHSSLIGVFVSLANYSCLRFDMLFEWDGKDSAPANEVGLQGDQEIALDANHVLDDEGVDPDDGMVGLDKEDSLLEDDEFDSDDKDDDGANNEHPSTKSNDGNQRKWLKVVDKGGCICKIWLHRILSISDSLVGQGYYLGGHA